MKYITDIKEIHANNGGKIIPVPKGTVNGMYSKGCVLYLCDGEHEGFSFVHHSREELFAEAERMFDSVPDGYHLYYLKDNGVDPRNPSHIYWSMMGEFVK